MKRTRVLLLLALLPIAHVCVAAELARMFYTPAQRATLDNARKQNIRVEIGNESEQQPAIDRAGDVDLAAVVRG